MGKVKKTPSTNIPEKERDLPATRGMLDDVRHELKADIRSLENKMEARFSDMDARFSTIDARFSTIDARFSTVDSRLSRMESKIDSIESTVARMSVLYEEQRSDNRIVLDAIKGLAERQDRVDAGFMEMRSMISALAAGPRRVES
jgi:chromosome segregation ATPase